MFDVDGKGEFTIHELCQVMMKTGLPFSTDELRTMFQEMDIDGNGKVTI